MGSNSYRITWSAAPIMFKSVEIHDGFPNDPNNDAPTSIYTNIPPWVPFDVKGYGDGFFDFIYSWNNGGSTSDYSYRDFIVHTNPNFQSTWNPDHTQVNCTIQILSYGPGFEQVVVDIPFILRKGDPVCLYDINGDGVSTGAELDISGLMKWMDAYTRRLTTGTDQLKAAEKIIVDLEQQGDNLTLAFGYKMLVHVLEIVSLGEFRYVTGITNLAKIPIQAYDAYNGDIKGPIKDAFLLGADQLNSATGQAIKMLPVISLIDAIIGTATDIEEFQAALAQIKAKIAEIIASRSQLESDLKLAKHHFDDLYKCVKHVQPLEGRADTAAHDVVEFKRGFWDLSSPTPSDQPFHSAKEFAKAATSPSGGKHITIAERSALTSPDLPDHFYVGVGSKGGDVVHATSANLNGTTSVCMVNAGAGDELIFGVCRCSIHY